MSISTQPPACPDFADRLVDLSDGELPADERLRVTTHVANCAACRAQLRRLDASLTVLRAGIVSPSPVASRRPVRSVLAIAAVVTAAALLVAVTIYVSNQRGRESLAETRPPIMDRHGPPKTPDPVASLTHEAALRQIALVEQQARLQTSLDLMPQDAWYAEARAANESVLAVLRQATSTAAARQQQAPPTKGTL